MTDVTRLEKRRMLTSHVQKNILGLTKHIDTLNVHNGYLNSIGQDELKNGLNALSEILYALYTGMLNEPAAYAMKDADDAKGVAKNTNFLMLLAQCGVMRNSLLEIKGEDFASSLKNAKVTKPEIYFKHYEQLRFVFGGLGKKIESSEKITVEFTDNKYLLTALKAMADAVGMFSGSNPNRGNSYFELLDLRVLEKHPATEPKQTMEYILSKLSGSSRDVAEMFYEFIKPHTKYVIKGGMGWYWTPTFTLKSTKKVIMSLKLDLVSHDVKLNLANISKYQNLLAGLPEKLQSEIINNGWDCGKCNSKCEGGFAFEFNGNPYSKCRGGSFVFIEPDITDSKLLLGLLENELQYT